MMIGASILVLGLIYCFLLRPWHLKWGATGEELRGHLPGDEMVPHPREQATHAITINMCQPGVMVQDFFDLGNAVICRKDGIEFRL